MNNEIHKSKMVIVPMLIWWSGDGNQVINDFLSMNSVEWFCCFHLQNLNLKQCVKRKFLLVHDWNIFDSKIIF